MTDYEWYPYNASIIFTTVVTLFVTLSSLIRSERLQDESKTNQDEITNTEDELDIKLSPATSTGLYRRLCKGMSLCVAYAASIGGTGLVAGTSPNLIMQEQAQE